MSDPTDEVEAAWQKHKSANYDMPDEYYDAEWMPVTNMAESRGEFYEAFTLGVVAGRASVTPSGKTITEQFEAYCRGQGIHTYSDLLQMIEDIADEPDCRPSREAIAETIMDHFTESAYAGGSWRLRPLDAADAVLALLGVVPSTGNKETK